MTKPEIERRLQGDRWDAADGETFDAVVYIMAAKAGVSISHSVQQK